LIAAAVRRFVPPNDDAAVAHEQRRRVVKLSFANTEVLIMFTKILVAVSASSSDVVLASAIETAQKYDAQIVALHVVDLRPCYVGAVDCNLGLIVEAMEAHGREVLSQARNTLDTYARSSDARMMTLPIMGRTVGRAIATVADDTGADLILVGARSSARWRWLNENVAAQVMRYSTKPTQIVTDKRAADPGFRSGQRWLGAPTARI
jgi:nucleotide-binding universal stress UspA family protein